MSLTPDTPLPMGTHFATADDFLAGPIVLLDDALLPVQPSLLAPSPALSSPDSELDFGETSV